MPIVAESVIKISLATKFRLLFATAVLGVIVVALVIPWFLMEMIIEKEAQAIGEELTRMRLNEWQHQHSTNPMAAGNENSRIVALYAQGADTGDRAGPLFVRIPEDAKLKGALPAPTRDAVRVFSRHPKQQLTVIKSEGTRGEAVFRYFRGIRARPMCMDCHQDQSAQLRFRPNQLVGVIEVQVPSSVGSRGLVWWTRLGFVAGGALAGTLAYLLFGGIIRRLVLRPIRQLRRVADKAAGGDLSVRSEVRTNDELQRLGNRFNEMLEAIETQNEKLRDTNRALDIKLSELTEANVALFHANKIKTEFLTNVSHELRTPLNSIIGFAELLSGSEDERVGRYAGNIRSGAKNLLTIINDLLDLAKIEAGKAEARFDKVSVTDTCQTLIALMKPLADKGQIDLGDELSEDVPIIVTDPGKLQQILYNLLSNAIKFTPPGGSVTIAATKTTPQGNGGGGIVVSVSDTGPGIPEVDQQHIFEKFYRTEQALTKQSGGTGLGLAIARELTNLLGGRLALKSSPGHGATFSVFLPLEPPQQAEHPERD